MHATLVHYAAVGVLLCLANVLLGAAAGHANEPAKVAPPAGCPPRIAARCYTATAAYRRVGPL